MFVWLIEDEEMRLNEAGRMLVDEWKKLKNRFINIEIDEFVVMPNHFHGIIFIPDVTVGDGLVPSRIDPRASTRVAPTIPNIIGAFKSIATHRYIQLVKQNLAKQFNKKLWQRSYYDHVIRNEKSLEKIREYVIENPCCWEKDENFMS